MSNIVIEKDVVLTERKQNASVNYPASSFTFKNLQELNPEINTQTLRIKLNRDVENGKVNKLPEPLLTGKRGRAEHLFVLA